MTVEIRKPGSQQWGAQWVRYTIGHPHEGDQPLNVAISLPRGDEMISRAEVFDAEEAGKLFMCYHATGDLPPVYVLRPVESWTADGTNIDLRDVTP